MDFNYGGPSAGAEELQERQRREIEPPIICLECGSSWFSEVNYNRYSGTATGSGPGGDIRVISQMMQTLRVCLCGAPYSPNISGIRGRTASADISNFMDSFGMAVKHRTAVAVAAKTPPVKMDALAQSFAGTSEVQRLADQVIEMGRKLDTIQTKNELAAAQNQSSQYGHNTNANAFTGEILSEVPIKELESPVRTTGNIQTASVGHAQTSEKQLTAKERKAAEKALLEKGGQ